MYTEGELQKARERLLRAYAELGTWREVGGALGLPYYDPYDFCVRKHTVSAHRERRVMAALGIPGSPRYWRPCLSPALKQRVLLCQRDRPSLSLDDIICAGLASIEDDHD